MWSILIAASKDHADAAVLRLQPASAGGPDAGAGPCANGNGHVPGPGPAPRAEEAVRADEAALVHVYLHPGRSYLGSMGLLRAAEQFDFGDSREFETVGEAESACSGQAGFLVESAADRDPMLRGRVRFSQRLRD